MSLMTVAEQQRHIEGIGHEWTLTLAERLRLAGCNLWFYAGKIVWPARLDVCLSALERRRDRLAAAGRGGGRGRRTVDVRRHGWARAGLVGLGCYVALLLPVLGLIDVYYFRFSFVADHFQYLAGAALIALLVAGVGGRVRERRAQLLLAVVSIAAFDRVSWAYCPAFHDEETLWRDTLARNPDSFMPQNNLGSLLFKAGQYQEACRASAGRRQPAAAHLAGATGPGQHPRQAGQTR